MNHCIIDHYYHCYYYSNTFNYRDKPHGSKVHTNYNLISLIYAVLYTYRCFMHIHDTTIRYLYRIQYIYVITINKYYYIWLSANTHSSGDFSFIVRLALELTAVSINN